MIPGRGAVHGELSPLLLCHFNTFTGVFAALMIPGRGYGTRRAKPAAALPFQYFYGSIRSAHDPWKGVRYTES